MAQKRTEQGLKNKREYDKAYMKQFFKGKTITFNTKNADDIALLDWIKAQPEEGTKYIKRLILEDMERAQNV